MARRRNTPVQGKAGKMNMEMLEGLVSKLLLECQFTTPSLPCVHLGSAGIRHHILDTLNER